MPQRSILRSLYDQFGAAPPVAKTDLTGKTVVVVGANTGLGFEATKHFAVMGPERLILACRSQEKGEAAIQSE
jgi:FlaA1/EpsC-like NDP-sugar epimerase